ncbi:LOW QUALITY PROTEIN: adenylate cyclase type 9-like [Anthonomus grandis grandis]|uniref:LOW QUALITY PROTEIN: adenylate cyclase type 9-like n=1 Tax=Anthonomus grandis grandis TaxID=2921223 RepID=UPI0021659777|nr:LOW QUALITY PROTEIN: adenylate cyclase type 9-like [Anthonomus grandis grandis]
MPSSQTNQANEFLKADIQDDHPSDIVDEEQVQLSLDPKFQVLLAQMSRESGCWGKFFPMPFERASQKSWWDPTFDSEILEDQYKKSAFNHNRFKFRYAVWYTICIAAIWLTYVLLQGLLTEFKNFSIKYILFFILLLYNILILLLTYTKIFQLHMQTISLSYALSSVAFSLVFLIVSQRGLFCHSTQLLILIYTLIPLKLYMALTLAIIYSVSFECLTSVVYTSMPDMEETVLTIFTKILSHIAIHLIGLHIYLMSNIRMRQTFMKVGQSLLVRRQLELEKRLKENMIHSLMPPSVAYWLLNEDESFNRRPSAESENNDLRSLFRPFNMDTMNDVSILFADIVGFTKMSSNKTAEELVDILNNLFQRFDDLCKNHFCEKISTLGDCYYCVSGCPKPRPDHAKCCVEMGLSMIQAIKQFDQERHEGINMRVGIHTGTVLCGIVGTKRFKFDVWSNDVTLANKMESTGKPGMVHISEKTSTFLNNEYLLEEGECVSGLKTFFILGRKTDHCPSYQGSIRSEGRQKYANSLQLFVSPPPSAASLSPHSRPRVLSCDTSHISKSNQNKNFLSPDSCIVKASSLPSILDSENEQDPPDGSNVESVKTPTSTASSGKYSMKIRNWKIPKFMRKTSTTCDSKPEIDVDFASGVTDASEEGYQQVPTIIETGALNGKKDSLSTLTSKYEDYPACKETIDIKSYISHSRSDIGAFDYSHTPEFVRGGSYRCNFGRSFNGDLFQLNRSGSSRSRRGRSPNLDILEPLERARSATVTVSNIARPKRSFDIPSRLSSIAMLDENSVPSRKDSGIRSNSRRSSLQMDNRLLSQERLQHRVSGYYTSSLSSMNSTQVSKTVNSSHGPFFDKYGTCIQNLRKQSDRQLIKCVQDNSKSQGSYFIKPPISQMSLFFKDKVMELDYRANVHRIHTNFEIDTLANSRFNTFLDIFVSIFVFLIVSITLAFIYGINAAWLSTFIACSILQSLNLGICVIPIVRWTDKVCCCGRFYRWNAFGAVLVSLPLFSVLVNFASDIQINQYELYMYIYPLFVGLLHFCNFTQLNSWMKSVIGLILSVSWGILFLIKRCTGHIFDAPVHHNATPFAASDIHNSTANSTNYVTEANCYLNNLDMIVNLFLLLLLVWLLNREFEITYRLSFHTNYIAHRDKSFVQKLKNQADYLIYNIVPEYVAEQLKREAKYSENFKDVGIIFASIVNFNEMYDESFEGGREYLRVLNELIGDFDELLYRKEFKCVEKIKTIGSTFMAASGLNSQMRSLQQDPNEHLYVLMDFAIEMQRVVENFNRDLLEFNLIIRIGYNFGDVTAAVIGNTKLYYDIWGDAVNIASRMDSTGVNGRIQVGEHCLPVLENKFNFEPRGSIYVKGKDNMNVYLIKERKNERNPELLNVPNS